MSDRDRGRCRACPAQIRWVVMASGKRNPLNVEPDAERGNVLIIESEVDADLYGVAVGRAVALGPLEASAEREKGSDLFLSHFATCPNRGQFRRR